MRTAKELRQEAEKYRRIGKRTMGNRVWVNQHLQALAARCDEEANAAEERELVEGARKRA